MRKPLNDIHIGSIIRREMKEQRRSAAWLAKQIPCNRSNIYRIYKKKTLDFDLLHNIAMILNIDFFVHYSNQFQRVAKAATV